MYEHADARARFLGFASAAGLGGGREFTASGKGISVAGRADQFAGKPEWIMCGAMRATSTYVAQEGLVHALLLLLCIVLEAQKHSAPALQQSPDWEST